MRTWVMALPTITERFGDSFTFTAKRKSGPRARGVRGFASGRANRFDFSSILLTLAHSSIGGCGQAEQDLEEIFVLAFEKAGLSQELGGGSSSRQSG